MVLRAFIRNGWFSPMVGISKTVSLAAKFKTITLKPFVRLAFISVHTATSCSILLIVCEGCVIQKAYFPRFIALTVSS